MVLTENNKRFLKREKERYGDDVEKIFDYSEVDFHRAKSPLIVRCIEHNTKDMLAKHHDIPLIRIPYTEFNNLKQVFFQKLSKIYMYRVGDLFYREFKDLHIGTVLPKTTTVSDANKYLI